MWGNSYSSDSESLTDKEERVSDDEKDSKNKTLDATAIKEDDQPFERAQSDNESESDALFGSPNIGQSKTKADRISFGNLNK